MTLRRPLAALCLVAALAPAALGDDRPKVPDSLPPEVQQMLADAMAKQQAPPVTFSVDFAGGTVTEYLEAIRKAYPKANIVSAAGLEAYTVPAITLKEVTIDGALKPLEYVAQATGGRSADLNVRKDDGVASVSVPQRSVSRSDALSTFVWNSKTLTANGLVSVADITGAIETALSVFPEEGPAIRIHEATGILAIRGTREQLSAVENVIDQLRETPRPYEAPSELEQAERSVRESQIEIHKLEVQIATIEERRARLDAGSERDTMDVNLFELRSELDRHRAALRLNTEYLERVQKSAAARSSGR